MHDQIPEKRCWRRAPVRRLYEQLGGASLTFAWVCLVLVTVLAVNKLLTTEYIAALGVLQALIVARAGVEDIARAKAANGSTASGQFKSPFHKGDAT